MKPKLKLFYHVCLFGHGWEQILKEQLRSIQKSGLCDKLDEIYLVLFGDKNTSTSKNDIKDILNTTLDVPSKTFIITYDSERIYHATYREYATLTSLFDDATKSKNTYYLYIHSKGISYPIDHPVKRNVDSWRQYMTYFLIDEYEAALRLLETCDAVGVNLTTTETDGSGSVPRHFSGNYWWAKGSYLKALCDPWGLPRKDVREPEFWIGSGTGELKSLHQSNVNHYRDDYPCWKYMYVWYKPEIQFLDISLKLEDDNV